MPRHVVDHLTTAIKQLIIAERLAKGYRLPERGLAARFNVSRSPIREALRKLAELEIVAAHPDGGYAVAKNGEDLEAASAGALQSDDDAERPYLRIAEDRLNGLLPDRITESELQRRYAVGPALLRDILGRMGQEGWIERLPGHGWRFLPVLTSADTYDQGYRFRILIESAALLEPTFRLDEQALLRCRDEQLKLLADLDHVSPAAVFDANSHLHEALAEMSGNTFIIDALNRLNRLRRLMEYRKAGDPEMRRRRISEHLSLIELVLSGQREAAADFMRLHLRDAAREKSASAPQPPLQA
jgi:DNA-binding GntR family transcriptional regulator